LRRVSRLETRLETWDLRRVSRLETWDASRDLRRVSRLETWIAELGAIGELEPPKLSLNQRLPSFEVKVRGVTTLIFHQDQVTDPSQHLQQMGSCYFGSEPLPCKFSVIRKLTQLRSSHGSKQATVVVNSLKAHQRWLQIPGWLCSKDFLVIKIFIMKVRAY